MNTSFREYCEKLWRQWIERSIIFSPYIQSEFQTEYLPEPYLNFKAGKNPLYVFTTNPGAGMDVQYFDNIVSGKSIISEKQSYESIAEALGQYYSENLKGTPKN